MRWEKKGRVFRAAGEFGWMHSHAQIPTVLVLEDRLRVYFATRPSAGLSVTAMLDLDIDDPTRVLNVHETPVLEPGPPGAFDEHGAMPSYVFGNGDEVWLYYGGWSRRTSIPYSNWTGLAVSRDGGTTFEKAFAGPILDRTPFEIFSATAPFVLHEGDDWHVWYASGEAWIDVDGKLEEFYTIKHADSRDGIHWQRDAKRLLSSEHDFEPLHRPTVIAIGGRYHMWFCHRRIRDFRDGAGSYRIGYASSHDLRTWNRNDALAGITVSPDGWDAKMTAYPYVVQARDNIYLFYNGNGFGADGFGCAVLHEAG